MTTSYNYDGNGNQTASTAGLSVSYNVANQSTTMNGTANTYSGADQSQRVKSGATTAVYTQLGLAGEATAYYISRNMEMNKMNKINWFDMSLAWKFFSVIVLIAFVLIGVILVLMRANFMQILGVEIGVIIAWLGGLLIYGVLAYLVQHTKRS